MADPTGHTAQNLENQLRDQIVQQLMANGFDRPTAQESVDLAFQAAQNCLDTLIRQVRYGANPVIEHTALSIALTLARTRIEQAECQMQSITEKHGLKTQNFEISFPLVAADA